jgi:hypothetical protein
MATTPDDSTSPGIEGYASVEKWAKATGQDAQSPETRAHHLEVLSKFTEFAGKTPDELVAYCFLRKKDTGVRFVSIQRRVAVNKTIDEFVEAQGWVDKEAVVKANIVRSFLIHNGVLIQGKLWRG